MRFEKKTEQRIIQSIESHINFCWRKHKETAIKNIVNGKIAHIKEVRMSEKSLGEQTAAILIALSPELEKITKLIDLAPIAYEIEK